MFSFRKKEATYIQNQEPDIEKTQKKNITETESFHFKKNL